MKVDKINGVWGVYEGTKLVKKAPSRDKAREELKTLKAAPVTKAPTTTKATPVNQKPATVAKPVAPVFVRPFTLAKTNAGIWCITDANGVMVKTDCGSRDKGRAELVALNAKYSLPNTKKVNEAPASVQNTPVAKTDAIPAVSSTTNAKGIVVYSDGVMREVILRGVTAPTNRSKQGYRKTITSRNFKTRIIDGYWCFLLNEVILGQFLIHARCKAAWMYIKGNKDRYSLLHFN